MPILRNPKHEAFARARAEGKTQTESYELAGFTRHRQNASRLSITNDDVQRRVAELQAKTEAEHGITVASLVAELDAAVTQATALNQPAVRISASALKARLAGLDRQKLEISEGPDHYADCLDVADVAGKLVAESDNPHDILDTLDELREGVAAAIAERARLIESPHK